MLFLSKKKFKSVFFPRFDRFFCKMFSNKNGIFRYLCFLIISGFPAHVRKFFQNILG